MATVVGKTSNRIDQLLGDLVADLAVVSNKLIATKRNGTTIDLGVVTGTQTVIRLFYENGAYPARPTNVVCVEWWGPSLPPSLTTKDSWVSTA